MKESTAWIVCGALILVVGGALITGYFTRWFGLVPEPPEIETLNIGGSTSVEPITSAVATAYMEDNPLVDVVITAGGSSVGISGVTDSSLDIGMVSRDGKDSEFTSDPDLMLWPICEDGIAIIVNPSNPITQLTGTQIRGIFSGAITNWNNATAFGADVWNDALIDVMVRDSDSGTQEVFNNWVGHEIALTASEYESNDALKTEVIDSQYSIGYVSMGFIDSTIDVLKVDDGSGYMAPSVESVQNGSYALTRDLYFATKDYPSELASDFIEFLMDQEGKAIVEAVGFAPYEHITGELTLTGSTTVEKIALDTVTWFEMMNPGITVTIDDGSSNAGISAVASHSVDIGMASRDLTLTETTINPELNATTIANDGIAVIVNPANPITNMTGDMIRGIFNGTITNWSNATAFGGDAWTDATIVVMNRDSDSGTRDAFKEWMGSDFIGTATEHDSNAAVKTAVIGSQYAIGFVGLGFVDSSVVALEIDEGSGSIAPTLTTVEDATYPILRDLYLITNGTVSTLSDKVQEYIGFMLSRTGQYIVKDANFAPLSGYIL